MPTIETVREVPTAHIRFSKIEGFENIDINGDVTFEISGKPTSKLEDTDGQSITLELTNVKVTSKERNDDGLAKMKRSVDKSLNRLPSENQPIPAPPG